MKDIQRYRLEDISRLQVGDIFLHNVTGDIYAYDSELRELHPIANIGMHHRKSAEESEIWKSTIIKTPVFRRRDPEIYKSTSSEAICKIQNWHNQHWLLQGLGLKEFVIPQKNAWDIHPTTMTDCENYYQVLAESELSPQIILLQNIVATQFNISEKYPATVKVLKNYINHTMKRYQTEADRLDLTLDSVVYYIIPEKATVVDFVEETEDFFDSQYLKSSPS